MIRTPRLDRRQLLAGGVAAVLSGLAGLLYPVGFYSEVRMMIARALPTHYSLVTLRGTMLRDVPTSLFGDYLAFLGASVLVAGFLLGVSIRYYERGGVHE